MAKFVARILAVVGLALAVTGTSAGAASASLRPSGNPPPPTQPTAAHVVLWGDSLAYESAKAFSGLLGSIGVTAANRTFPGTAPCDWLDDIRATVATGPIEAAVLEFSGNAFTPCMQGPDGRPLTDAGVVARYRRDLSAAVAALTAAGARVYLAAAPTFADEVRGDRHDLVRRLAHDLAEEHPMLGYVDAGAAVTTGGRFTSTLPCRPWERADGDCRADRTVVRSPDGVHFCPRAAGDSLGLIAPCPVRSPGAERFGQAMAGPVAGGFLLHHVAI